MKIAFVGKGGSGKSTMSSLFTRYLLSQKQDVLVIDADLNIHVPRLLGIDIDLDKALSSKKNIGKIRNYLKGDNKLIKSIDHFYKTTPPASGSNFLEFKEDNELLRNFATRFDSRGYCMVVGTYKEEGIGTSCYHENLSVFENVLSHAAFSPDQWIVADMVAGIDAFSNTLHAQFDALFLIVEPTIEGVEVYNQYKKLAQTAGISDRLFVVGNKVEDSADLDFLHKKMPGAVIGAFVKNQTIKRQRQQGDALTIDSINKKELDIFGEIFELAKKNFRSESEQLAILYSLHRKYAAKASVQRTSGDITGQIDPNFSFPLSAV